MKAVTFPYPPFVRRHEQLDVEYDKTHGAVWASINGNQRPSFTPTLLDNIGTAQRGIVDFAKSGDTEKYPINFLVTSSKVPGIYNLGGDLALFSHFIENQDREGLLAYAHKCIDVLYQNIIGLGIPVTTIALVEGSALGGGFEAALSCDVIVAERGSEFGFPEVLFNLFPGMGAYTLLARKVPMYVAERMITNGRMYKSEELFDLGIVDVLVQRGKGRESVERYMKQYGRTSNGRQAIRQVRDRVAPVTYEELIDVTDIWVDTALRLEPRDLRLMNRLVKAQDQNAAQNTASKMRLVAQ